MEELSLALLVAFLALLVPFVLLLIAARRLSMAEHQPGRMTVAQLRQQWRSQLRKWSKQQEEEEEALAREQFKLKAEAEGLIRKQLHQMETDSVQDLKQQANRVLMDHQLAQARLEQQIRRASES